MFEFWRFKVIDETQYQLLGSEFNFPLVFLSIVVAILASYSTLVVLDRVWSSDNKNIIRFWLLFGSFVLGIGVWAMHFTGMLAYIMPVEMSFDPLTTTISVLPIFIGAYFTLRQITLYKFDFLNIQLSALSLALGIGTMHFIGMEAMLSNALMVYNLPLFLASILVAYVLASITLYLVALETKTNKHKWLVRILCSSVMGATISSMHYMAMVSVSFYVSEKIGTTPMDAMGHGSFVIPVAIAGIISVLVITTVLCALIDKRLQAAELSAKESAIREKDIVEHLPDGLLLIDPEGQIVSANTAAQNMFNLTGQAIKQLKIEQLVPAVTYSKLVDDVVLFDHELLGQTVVIDGIKKNGETFPIEAHFSKMTLVIDFQVMFSCVMRDITERLLLEKQLYQAQKLESIGQLAAGIAHEINTPTQYVIDNTSFLESSFTGIAPVIRQCQALIACNDGELKTSELEQLQALIEQADVDFLLEEIPMALSQSLEGLHRISTIVKAMKSFSHPSKGEMQLTSLAEAIDTTITVARNEWRYIAELTTHFDENIPKVNCVRDELNQVFLNIIVNAAHAIEEKAKTRDSYKGEIKISTYQNDTFVIIEICDNGAGMTEEVQARIFDPFYTTKGVGKGTGQGLSLAYSVIVERHQGKIDVNSILGEGSTFIISLPIRCESTQVLEDVETLEGLI
ncbi:MHYT domain-containing protein [Litorilituus sediminis]|uniref:histidine kinase n=1 Tax=Litorilituus sediminis TaxID=718192 RepID=A0A4P6P6N9_9GAMM|nr:MHYT domain-containing protein [Litorilituus sediminis]QBG35045.1 PAS domain-containing protein [Litorilituus sediminis]